ncbi:hypothetical protein [Deinococcus sonorensis]|uniref:Uncharacterized protein n=2 Tax=Deinococcus sonorensis TaxID=309891 RepID=A0AAU7UEM7_9DEIO
MPEHVITLQPGEHALYQLRIWLEDDGGRPRWRASVKPPHEEQRRVFTSPDALLRYLESCLSAVEPSV